MSTVANAPVVIDNIRPGGSATGAPAGKAKAGDDDVSFWDFVDIINPLQHLPIISTIYREITGDTIKPLTRVAGGALFGGVIGVAAAVVTQVVEEAAGLQEGETLLSLFDGDEGEAPTQVAQGDSATDRIGRYATATPAGAEGGEVQTAAAMPASAGNLAAPPASAPAAAGETTTAGADARFFPAAQAPAGFMPIRASDFRPTGALTRMPAPEKRPAGLSPADQMAALRPSYGAAAARPAQADDDGAQYLSVPSKAQMAAAEAQGTVAQASADDAVMRALEAQGLKGEAAKHPMLQAAFRPASAAPLATPAAASAPVTGAAGYATAAESVAAAEAAAGGEQGPQAMPGWFDQAMLKALDRYQQTGRLNTATAG
ncbi:hypothetical protein [Caenispirillum bisanense]|uniref:Uncharacterized protein n=1 Tax=Caenispirillum bisanense TaxID=414052 RepID=A0A286GUW8_9PROT|nr:hypothetical protein [Caenispirillum bisanense]SOD98976.1 hypothetical protein SAMN05421508_108169 [Caenispirillum bisanense]